MFNLLREARARLPFQLSFDGYCEGRCLECPFKLLEFLDADLSDWEHRLQRGDAPTLGELHSLGRDCQEVYLVLQREGLIQEVGDNR